MTACGWPSDLSSASDGPDILLHSVGYLRLGHGEAFQDRVPAGPRLRRVRDGLGEVGVRHAQVGWRPRQSVPGQAGRDRKSTRLNSSHVEISYAVFCLKKKKKIK